MWVAPISAQLSSCPSLQEAAACKTRHEYLYLHDDDFDHDDEDFDDCEVVFHIPFWIPPLSLDKYILAYIVFYSKTENKQVYLFVGRPCFS